MQVNHPASSIEEMAQAFEEDAAPSVDLSRYAFEDWLTLAVFWMMGISVFLQFFTRYALNNSLSWTEEIATNCLMVVVFMGAVMCVRTSRNIHVDVLYHFLPPTVGRVLALVVDILVICFFAYMSLLDLALRRRGGAPAHDLDRRAALLPVLHAVRSLRPDALEIDPGLRRRHQARLHRARTPRGVRRPRRLTCSS